MANDIPAYDAHDPVPWNMDSGKVPTGDSREGVPVAWTTDIQSDPSGNGADPTAGWKRGIGIGSPQA